MSKIIKLFTMVKDEDDIVEDWINYHGSLFGFHNLYIIDNYSSDKTYDILKKYEENKKINLYRKKKYRLKGEYMTYLMNKNVCDLAYPIDIDEFIVHYDKIKNIIDPLKVVSYLNSLSLEKPIFKANYINSLIEKGFDKGYERASIQGKYGKYEDLGILAKSFFHKKIWDGKIDHGNHYPIDNYYLTDIVLVHYHCRNYEQYCEKTINNVKGLGYNHKNIKYLIQKSREKCAGYHHVDNMIRILKGIHTINNLFEYNNQEDIVKLEPLSTYISKLYE